MLGKFGRKSNMIQVFIPFLKYINYETCCLCKEMENSCAKNSDKCDIIYRQSSTPWLCFGSKDALIKRSCTAGWSQCWCKTCILSCNFNPHEHSADNTNVTFLLVATIKFFLYKSQMLTSVQQLQHCLITMTVSGIY